jgi:hypothetical protein
MAAAMTAVTVILAVVVSADSIVITVMADKIRKLRKGQVNAKTHG